MKVQSPANTPDMSRESGGRSRIKRRRSVKGLLLPLILPALFCVAWQIVATSPSLGHGMFPSLMQSLLALQDWVFGGRGEVFSGTWAAATLASAGRVLAGFSLGSIVAIVVGISAGVSSTMRSMVDPGINALRSVSISAWVPLALILFGIGFKPAVFLTALCTFFPVYVNVLAGARSVDRKLIQAADMLGASRFQIVTRVVIPWTLPAMVTGLRVAAALAWTTVVIAEMLGAQSGIGYTLIYSYNQFQFDYVVAGMIAAGAVGFLTDKIIELCIERRINWVEKRANR
jgi:NitT/TauT family transport system permease protein